MSEEQSRDRTKIARDIVHSAIDELKGTGYYGCAEEVIILMENYDRLNAEVTALKKLVDYSDHRPDCAIRSYTPKPCSCGYWDALSNDSGSQEQNDG